VGLSEIWVLVALFVGGELFGFLGVLLAVPAAGRGQDLRGPYRPVLSHD
jgi:predicted PurR-regulated permease PerM